MTNIMVLDIIKQQKLELERKLTEKYIPRESKFIEPDSDLIKVIIGPRRAGKSFFTIHSLKNKFNFGYANFDDERLIKVDDYDKIISAINGVYNFPKVLFFDEIQNLKDWELFVNRLQRTGYNLFLTGSNSKLLSGELAAHLTGRHTVINIFPFSFSEIIKSKGSDLPDSVIKGLFSNYMFTGGFPEIQIKNYDAVNYLSTLIDNIVFKDIFRRYKIRSISGIEDLALFLFSNISDIYSYRTLSELSLLSSDMTVRKYLRYFEEVYLFFTVNAFSFKMKEQLKSGKKIFTIDNGFISAKSNSSSRDSGKLFENLIAVYLKELEIEKGWRIYYWRNNENYEVDFVIKDKTKITTLIQVCYDISNSKTKSREIRALLYCSREFNCDNAIVVTNDYSGEEVFEAGTKKVSIRFIPAYKFLSDNYSQRL
jgi:hypothetical protein